MPCRRIRPTARVATMAKWSFQQSIPTPSGRLETGKRLCLSMTDFHPESWNPAWSVETILVGLLSFFISDEKGYGSVRSSEEQRKLLAEKSWESNAGSAVFRSLFPEFLHMPETSETSEQDAGDPSPPVPVEAQVSHESFEVAPEALEEGVVPVVPVSSEHRSERLNSSSECWICRDVTDESFWILDPFSCYFFGNFCWLFRQFCQALNASASDMESKLSLTCEDQWPSWPSLAPMPRNRWFSRADVVVPWVESMPVAWRSGFEAIGERHVMMRPHAALCATNPIKAMASMGSYPKCQGYGCHDIDSR